MLLVNLYSQQIYQQKGKMYEPTTFDEISLFIGINILMGIKKMCSYRDYWSSAPDLNHAYLAILCQSIDLVGYYLIYMSMIIRPCPKKAKKILTNFLK